MWAPIYQPVNGTKNKDPQTEPCGTLFLDKASVKVKPPTDTGIISQNMKTTIGHQSWRLQDDGWMDDSWLTALFFNVVIM